jgi:type II secretory pathway component PulC
MSGAQVSPPVLSKVLAEKVVGLRLFGGGASGIASTESAPIAVVSNIGVRGVYASRDGRSGFAVLVVDGNPISAVTGQEFLPGLVLQRVYPDSVDILRGGQLETARMAAVPGSASGTSGAAVSSDTSSALKMTVQQLGPRQYGISRAALLDTLKRADQLALLGRYGSHPRGGARLDRSPAGGLPEKLGLKVGDVVTGINGKPLSGPSDVARLYQLLTKSERVSVDVLRAGEKMNYSLQVSP